MSCLPKEEEKTQDRLMNALLAIVLICSVLFLFSLLCALASYLMKRWEKFSVDIPSQSYTLAPQEEKVLWSTDSGMLVGFVHGDGSDNIYVRLYANGKIEDEFPGTDKRVFSLSGSDIRIAIYNPHNTEISGTNPSINLRGVA